MDLILTFIFQFLIGNVHHPKSAIKIFDTFLKFYTPNGFPILVKQL
jgi:hypothetical protein